MPTYDFECLKEKGGCGKKKAINCSLSEHDELRKKPLKCSKCAKPMSQLPGTFRYSGWAVSRGIQD